MNLNLSIIELNSNNEDFNSFNPKLLSKETRIHFLTECLTLPSSAATKQKLKIELVKESNKIAHLIQQKLLTKEEEIVAEDCFNLAQKFLESDHVDTTLTSNEKSFFPEWLKSDGKSILDKHLTTVLGDPYAKAADMEGAPTSELLSLVCDFLKTCPNFLSKQEWLTINERLADALKLSQIIIDKDAFPKNVKTLKNGIKQALNDKKTVLLTGGWAAKPGHALYYQIVPQENGKYTFQIFNRGAGIKYAPSSEQEFKTLYSPFIEIIDIEKNKITDELFLKIIIEQNCFTDNPFNKGVMTHYQERDVFETLISMLDGKENERNFELEDLMSPQRHGTCPWKSFTAVLRTTLGYIPSKHFKLRFEVYLLWNYYLSNEKALSWFILKCHNLSWAIQAVTKTVQTMQGLISAEEYIQLIDLLGYLENCVKQAKAQDINLLAEMSPSVPLTSEELKLSEGRSTFSATLSAISNPFRGGIYKIEKRSHQSSNLIVQLNEWKPSAEALLRDLDIFSGLCGKALQQANYSDVNQFFLGMMRELPVPTTDLSTDGGKFWQEVIQKHPESIAEVMQAIAQLHEHYYISCFYIEGSFGCPPERTHAIVKSLHIQNILKLHSPLAQLGLTMPSDYTYLEQIFSEGKYRELNFCPTDPLIMHELGIIYHDLKLMAKPFLSDLIKDRGDNIYQIKGLAFEWKNDVVAIDDTGIPYSIGFNSVNSKYLNPEFAFIEKQLKTDPEYFKKAAENHDGIISGKIVKSKLETGLFSGDYELDEFHEMNIYHQIAWIYCYGSEELLPNPFLQWRDQVLQAQLMLYGYFFPPPNIHKIKDQENLRIRPTFSASRRTRKSEGIYEYIIKYQRPPIILDDKSIKFRYDSDEKNESIDKAEPFLNTIIPNRYLPNIRSFSLKAMKQIHAIWKTTPKLTQNEIYSQTYPEIDMPLHQKRELLTLGTHHELQVEEAVAYFSKNLHLLKERDYQTLFHILLFERDFLVKEIDCNPQMVSYLENLVKNGYQLAYDSADIESCVYFIHLSRHLQITIAFVYPIKKTNFIPIQESLLKLLSITGIANHDKSLLYQELLVSFSSQKTINQNEAILFIRSLVYLSMHPIMMEVLRPDTLQEQQDALAKHRYHIQNLLQKKPNDILNEALAPIIDHYSPNDWKEFENNHFESAQGYVLNPFTGDLFQKNQPAASLPAKILANSTYKKLFKKNYPAERIDFRTYDFCDDQGDDYRIILKDLLGGSECTFQRFIDGRWHQLQTSDDLFFKGISIQYHAWLSCDFRRIELYDFSGIRRAYAKVTKGDSHELSDGTLTSKQSRVDIPHRYPDHLVNEEFTYILPSQLRESSLNFLTYFEEDHFINVWKDKTETARLIELPRFNLTFFLDTKNPKQPRWKCSQLSGYYLAAKQFCQPMGLIKRYLVLENKKKEQLIFQPLQLINDIRSENPVFSENITFSPSGKENSFRYVSHTLSKGKDGSLALEPTNSEAGLYLAYLKLITGHYDEARYFLSFHRLPLRGNCEKEFHLLREMIKLREINKDDTGPGTALRLHAFYLYLELAERTGQDKQEDKEFWDEVKKDGEIYVNQIFNTGSFQLPIHEERIVLHAILEKFTDNSVSPFLINYLKNIDPEFPHEQILSSRQIPLENTSQKNLYEAVKNASQHFNDTIKSETESFINCYSDAKPLTQEQAFNKAMEQSNRKNDDDLKYLVTRPTQIGIHKLLVKWMINSDKKATLKAIDECLNSSVFDETSSTSIFRAVLEMIRRHPNKYTISPLTELTAQSGQEGDKARGEWFLYNMLPILKDYLSEIPVPENLSLPQRSVSLKPSSNSISLRKKGLPSRESGYINTRPESLILHEKILPTQKFSTFRSKDYLVAQPQSEVEKIKLERKEAITQAYANAKKIFSSEKAVNRCVSNEYFRLRDDCKAHAENVIIEIENYDPKIVPKEKLHELKHNLELTVQNLQLSLHERKKILTNLVNPPERVCTHSDAKIKAPFLAGKKEKIGIEMLILLYARGRLEELSKQPSSLQPEDIVLLTKLIFEYLEQATYMQQMQRALERTDSCIKQLEKTASIDPKKMQKLVYELTSSREEKEKYPACLALEYWDNILMHPEQMEKMKLFYETGDIQPILQMIMGAGKTSTLIPLLALFLANGFNLAILMLPEELLQSFFDELKMKLGEGFMQHLFPFVYGRNSNYSVNALRKLKNKLLNVIKDGHCLISTPKSFSCFYLKAIETWSAIKRSQGEKRIELKQQYKQLREILNIFRKKGVVLMDEVHLIQYCRNEVNFPTGNIAAIKDRDMDMICEIYETLLQSDAIKPYLKAEFDPKANSNAPPYTASIYHLKIKPILANEILSKMKNSEIAFGNKTITVSMHEYLNQVDDKSILQFLCHDKDGYEQAYDYVNEISNGDVKNLLFLAQKAINDLLPCTLQQDCDDDYGVRTKRFATPLEKGKPILTYEKGNLVEGTRYEDPFESSHYTYQSYYKNGIPVNIVKEQIETLQKQAIDELKSGKTAAESEAFKEFRELSGSETLHLLKLAPKDFEKITENIKNRKDLFRLFIKRYIFSYIRFYTRKLNSNAQTLSFLFSRMWGFSGTTSNAITFPDSQTSIPSKGTDARTIFALLGHAGKPVPIDIVNFDHPKKFIAQLPFEKDELVLIDSGAYLKGDLIANEAKELLKEARSKNPSIEGVAYFDDEGKKVILEHGKDQPIPLKDSKIKMEKRFTIFPKPFTTGANILQSEHAIAYFTVGRNLTLQDFLQAVFRMREIEHAQAIRLCISHDVKLAINSMLNRAPETAITMEDVLEFSAFNQANQVGEDAYLSLKQKMLASIIKAICEIIFDEELDGDDVAELFTDAVEEVFAPMIGEEPSQLYGGKEVEEKAEDVLDRDIKYFTKLLAKVLESSKVLKEKINQSNVEKEIELQRKETIVPENLTYRQSNSQNKLMQAQEQSETQTQTHTMQHTLQQSSQEETKQWRYYEWPDGNIYDSSYYQPGILKNLRERSWNQISDYIPLRIQGAWDFSVNLAAKAWRWIPELFRDGISLVGEEVITGIKLYALGNSWMYPLNEFLAKESALNPLISLFEGEGLKVSHNFAPKMIIQSNDHIASPFDESQKLIRHLLVSKNVETGEWGIMLLDKQDAVLFRNKLADPQKGHIDDLKIYIDDLKICLLDLQLGSIEAGFFSPSAEELESDDYLSLLIKIKFLKGETLYTKAEAELMRKWIPSQKWQEIKNVYRSHILTYHPDPAHVIKALDTLFLG